LGNLNIDDLLTVYSLSTYFIHLAYLDHCPNVVIDAAALGCHVICSSSGGTSEIAGTNCTVLEEEPWDFSFIEKKEPPKLDYNKKLVDFFQLPLYNMTKVSKQYYNFLQKVINEK
jgi:glycosyltransferase involved in cell wall biosynthesis